uniref:SFR19-like C-terminal domain-containing protein n=1 Tax=Monopterus albus TaxID=43700 RepID=A0A3Q3IFS6_MONAL
MDLTPASGFKRRPAASSPPSGIREIGQSPPTYSSPLSLSSPSSDPSSPLSTSSSVCANLSVYQNHVKDYTQGTEVARVSSTSVSLATQSFATPTPNTTSPDSFPHTSLQPSVDRKEEGRRREMYDPFHPTEGDKEGRVKEEEEEEEEEGEKYDPFDPTGSPASDTNDGSGQVRGVKRKLESRDEEVKEEAPPDSTDTLTDLPTPCVARQLPLRRRVDCSTTKAVGQRESPDSDHSEIEEGEIVGAADKDGNNKRSAGEILPLNSPSVSFFSSKPERILRVLDGDGFVSVCAEGNWEVDRQPEDEPVVGVEDLRRKLVSRRKERYLSLPVTSPLSPQPPPPPSHPSPSNPSSPLSPTVEQASKSHRSSKSSKDRDRQKSKDRKEERRKKRKKDKEGVRERSKDKERGHKTGKEVKGRTSSRSSSRKRKKRRHSSPEASRSYNSSGRGGHTRRSFSNISEERHKEREGDRERDRIRDRERDRERGRERDRDRESEQNRTSSHRRDDRDQDSSSRKERERKGRRHSSSRERGISMRSKRSREKREGDRDRQRERDRRRDGRPVVPPSIQDLNGSDLFAIKRTITVTTTTTTTTVPGSPRITPPSPCRPPQDSDKPYKRKKKRKWRSAAEVADRGSCHSRSQSLSPPRYHSYESDRYSDKMEIDVSSLDGEALDSDYPSLEDTPPAVLPREPPVPSPKTKTTPKTGRHHPKKKSRTSKKIGQSESSSSNRTKGKCLSSLTVTSGSASISSGLPSVKRTRKMGKDKERDKVSRKDLARSSKSKKESSSSRKGKLQSKVSVLVREGVSSTGGSAGGSVVGGSIAVVFCRDNESRSPFLKPCSEPLSLGGRSKDLASMGKRSSLAAPTSSLTSPAGLKSKKTKPKKGGAAALTAGDGSQTKATSEGWGGASLDVQSAVGDGSKSVSPHTGQAGPAPSSSSSSSSSSTTSVPPPSSSPPHTSPPSMAPLRDTRESSPDSQTVDSSCKTPDPSFLAEDCPTQTSPTLPTSSPSSQSTPQGAGLTAPALPWSLQTGVDCTTGGVLALTALLFKMEEANIASRAKAQEFIQATSQVRSQQHAPPSSASSTSSQIPPPPSLPPPPGLSPAQFILHSSLPLVGCTKTPPSHLHSSMGGGCYLKKLHTQERAVEEVKLAIKPYYQRKDINKDEYKDILRKAVHKICHSRTGEINPVKVSNLVKLYVQRYKYFRKHGRKMDEEERDDRESGALHSSA